jgi:hypothetical protein
VVRLVVQHEHVRLPAHLAAEHAIHEGGVALDVANRFDLDLLQSPLLVMRFTEHVHEPGGHLA